MTDVTQILSQIEQGDSSATERLLPLVYDELRKLAAARMAKESPDHTLQPTALVHEAYVRMVDAKEAGAWDSRGHFFAAAAEAMRRILIESARRKKRLKRGGARSRLELDEFAGAELDESRLDELLDLDAALAKLSQEAPQTAEVVQLRFFAGLSVEETATILDVSVVTVKRRWRYARAWLHREVQRGLDSDGAT